MNNQKGGISYFDAALLNAEEGDGTIQGFTWNPVTGCTKGCPECWARDVAQNRLRKSLDVKLLHYVDTRTFMSDPLDDPGYKDLHKQREAYRTFKPTLWPARLGEPAARKKPATIGVCFMGDLFDPALDKGERFAVLNTLDLSPWHSFVLLTKQPETMHRFLITPNPKPNWYLGFSARTQEEFDAGWPHMAKLAAAGWKVWVSLEPLHGPVDISKALYSIQPGGPCTVNGCNDWWVGDEGNKYCEGCDRRDPPWRFSLSGVIVGAQSGKGAPVLNTDWVRSIRDQCAAAGVPFMLKQMRNEAGKMITMPELDGVVHSGLAWSLSK